MKMAVKRPLRIYTNLNQNTDLLNEICLLVKMVYVDRAYIHIIYLHIL